MKKKPDRMKSRPGALVLLTAILVITGMAYLLPAISVGAQSQEIATGLDSLASTAGKEAPDDTSSVPPRVLDHRTGSWIGDFDGMVERRFIRALVVYNATNFFFDEEGQPRGFSLRR